MECYHGVPSLNHLVYGSLALASGKTAFFSGTPGYIEKDRGRNFPSSWIWLQSNDFGIDGTSLTASIAVIPYLGLSFPGQIVGFLHNGTLYRFTTYTGGITTELKVTNRIVEWTVEDAVHLLQISVTRPVDESSVDQLWGPRNGSCMEAYVNETLGSSTKVGLYLKPHPWARQSGSKLLFHGQGNNAGLEVMATSEQIGFANSVMSRILQILMWGSPLGHPIASVLLLMALLAWLGIVSTTKLAASCIAVLLALVTRAIMVV